ncbi:MAG: SDR family NAD(P)-dependent oxidoreductase [Bacteroidota bacterium]
MTYLITGGAGFIGTHLCRHLLNEGHNVKILDCFNTQIHGDQKKLPSDVSKDVELFTGDIRDRELLIKAIAKTNGIIHLAAETGTGQSMYEIDRYFSVNVQGTAVLLDILQNHEISKSIETIVVASSRAIYGEGAYKCMVHGTIYPDSRNSIDLAMGKFDPGCPFCTCSIKVIPTNEIAPFKPMSVYGLTKQVQEQAILMFARTRDINGIALRYQNVYGPGQSLKNPYTGILAVFSTLAKRGQDIEVYEDGQESRDFVYIDDVINATVSALKHKEKFVGGINVGSGEATKIETVAEEINSFFGKKSSIFTSGAFRIGDIRHNVADLSLAKDVLRFEPKTHFREGVSKFLQWAENETYVENISYSNSVNELTIRGLMGQAKIKKYE